MHWTEFLPHHTKADQPELSLKDFKRKVSMEYFASCGVLRIPLVL